MLSVLVRLFILWALVRLALDALQHRPAVLAVGVLTLVAAVLVVRYLLLHSLDPGIRTRQRTGNFRTLVRLSGLRTYRVLLVVTTVLALLWLVGVLLFTWVLVVGAVSGGIRQWTAGELASAGGVLLAVVTLLALAVRFLISALRRNREDIEAAMARGTPPAGDEAGPQAAPGPQQAPWPGRRMILVR